MCDPYGDLDFTDLGAYDGCDPWGDLDMSDC